MPNTTHAKKSLRQSIDRRQRNRGERAALRTVIKKYLAVAAGEDADAALTAYRLVVKKLDQAGTKHLLHKNKVARMKSRLAARMSKAGTTGA